MDYPQLNLLLGLGLILAVLIDISLRVLLSKMDLSFWYSAWSWAALAVSLLAAVYIESLFLRYISPVFNRQIGLAMLLIGSIASLVTAALYRRVTSSGLSGVLLGAQTLTSLASLVLAVALYRSLVPIPQA